MIFITPPNAPDPYKVEVAPFTISTFFTISKGISFISYIPCPGKTIGIPFIRIKFSPLVPLILISLFIPPWLIPSGPNER